MKFKTTILLLTLLLTFASCYDNYVSSIPSYPVSLQVDLRVGQYVTFRNSFGQYLLIEKPIFQRDQIGFGGILVYSEVFPDDAGNTIYYAYDMACPYEAKSNIKVYPIKDAFGKVKCSECGSVYDVGNGWGLPEKLGPSKERLKPYKINFLDGILYIHP